MRYVAVNTQFPSTSWVTLIRTKELLLFQKGSYVSFPLPHFVEVYKDIFMVYDAFVIKEASGLI